VKGDENGVCVCLCIEPSWLGIQKTWYIGNRIFRCSTCSQMLQGMILIKEEASSST